MNRVVLVGRLTRDPEMRTSASGIAQTRFTLAVNRRTTGPDGKREADFINCVAWRGTAENIAKFLKQGRELAIEGRIQTGSYTAQDGTKRYTTDVVVDNFTFIGGGQGGQQQDVNNQEPINEPTPNVSEEDNAWNDIALSDDDLPF